MSVDKDGKLTVLDCRMLDGRDAIMSIADMGIRDRCLRGVFSKVYTSRIRLVAISNNPKHAKTRFSRVPVDIADESGNASGYRASCDKVVMEELGIDVSSLFA